MRVEVITALDEVDAADWNRLSPSRHPFVRHAFLAALERHQCVSPARGWQPCHLLLRDEDDQLLAAMPQYLKNHSRGEFVFDWAWADAFEQHGIPYYPKLVGAIPFTPVPGPRLLVAPGTDRAQAVAALLGANRRLATSRRISSAHWLFPDDADREALAGSGLLLRKNLRFAWHNQGWRDFDHYLAAFTAAKRKKIRRERRRVVEQGLVMEVVHGDQADPPLWSELFPLYATTYMVRGQAPYLSQPFFEDISAALGRDVVLFIARDQGRAVACAITLRDEHNLYGRHWGCAADYHSLHFETCYYSPLEYCFREGLTHFDPGTQGEHKLSRGFLPQASWSAHWVADDRFRDAIADFLEREAAMVDAHLQGLAQHSPFRSDHDAAN